MNRMDGLARLHERAGALGWRCRADVWQGNRISDAFECAKGHRFERHATTVLLDPPECLQRAVLARSKKRIKRLNYHFEGGE
ncbi:hypothetical protein [Paraburkholderia adhaesiva]|uniref:hypothetical protein n=1 Tax=Paraburkholderia adhaesiva TaxID=2883244 RepID=UPI001F442B12|nr:hypothetical protein [Paraburkholderia adhaesiva]